MSLDIVVDIQLLGISRKDIQGILLDVKSLEKLPPLKVDHYFRDRQIYYEGGKDNRVVYRNGQRIINVTMDRIGNFVYGVCDRAHVKGSTEHFSKVADRDYTEKELKELRKKRRTIGRKIKP